MITFTSFFGLGEGGGGGVVAPYESVFEFLYACIVLKFLQIRYKDHLGSIIMVPILRVM